ncbi:two-component sensor histidine kinase [Pseudodesulfovibrio sp. JC047]|uniref:sensor histidine kinase n=1 Tax=Pseudodesulfovibrio sp. JC047 TaxID=2683199 RepID=UPI0013D0D345|nr:PAS domain-containing sensor histidine kinase [Pseudodesulfovibrio sp. JC047]NDV18500.1 two-component sensor histidine kinase [Pseudodesulfovibrio sp. JC047]
MSSEKNVSYNKLSRNIALTIIAVSLAPLILVGGLIFDQFRSIYHEKVYAHLAELVDKHKHEIDTFLKEKLSEIQYLNKVFTYDQLSDPVFIEKTLKGLRQQYGRIFVDLGVIDENGKQVAYAGPLDLLGADYSQAEWYTESRDKTTYISDVFMGLRRSPHFIITINNMEKTPWTLRASIDFLAFSSIVENIRIGETGRAYILNQDGVYQTTPLNNHTISLDPAKSSIVPAAVRGVTIREGLDENDETYITVSSPMKNGEWTLVYQQHYADAFSAMTRSESVTLLIFLLGGCAIVATAILISRKLVIRLQSMDVESELMSKQIVETGKLAAIGELAAGIAHEINNPVAIMIEEAGWVSDLLDDEKGQITAAPEIDRALRQVRTQGQRCKDITHKLLSFARQSDSRVTEISLPSLIEEVVDISMQQAKYAKVDFSLNFDPNLPKITASTTELQQVLLNLVNNSIQAMEPVGGVLSIICTTSHGSALILVEDTGPGIPAANLNRIFDPFFTTKPVGKGSGLGLSICFGIIHQMGGEIEVESTVGKGTRFTLRFPLPHPMNQEPSKEKLHD